MIEIRHKSLGRFRRENASSGEPGMGPFASVTSVTPGTNFDGASQFTVQWQFDTAFSEPLDVSEFNGFEINGNTPVSADEWDALTGFVSLVYDLVLGGDDLNWAVNTSGVGLTWNGGATTADGQSGTVAFSPKLLASLSRWFRADQAKDSGGNLITVDGTAVATWVDQNSNANATQTVSGSRPIYKSNIVNSKPVIRFDGIDDNLNLSLPSGVKTLFLATDKRSSISAVTQAILGSLSNGILFTNSSTGTGWNWFSNETASAVSLGGNVTVWGVLSISVNSNSSMSVYLNGILLANFDPADVALTDTIWALGSKQNGSNPTDCDMAEMIVFSVSLSSTDRSAIENYLMTRYGI